MKRSAVFIPMFILLLSSGCSDKGTPLAPGDIQQLQVYVYSGVDQPVARIAMEILETGARDTTDTTGTARFGVTPGEYTVRVYGLNGPGPALRTKDFPVSVKPGEDQYLEVFDCLECK